MSLFGTSSNIYSPPSRAYFFRFLVDNCTIHLCHFPPSSHVHTSAVLLCIFLPPPSVISCCPLVDIFTSSSCIFLQVPCRCFYRPFVPIFAVLSYVFLPPPRVYSFLPFPCECLYHHRVSFLAAPSTCMYRPLVHMFYEKTESNVWQIRFISVRGSPCRCVTLVNMSLCCVDASSCINTCVLMYKYMYPHVSYMCPHSN